MANSCCGHVPGHSWITHSRNRGVTRGTQDTTFAPDYLGQVARVMPGGSAERFANVMIGLGNGDVALGFVSSHIIVMRHGRLSPGRRSRSRQGLPVTVWGANSRLSTPVILSFTLTRPEGH